MEMVLKVTAERDGHLLRLNDHRISKKSSERKLLERDVILKTMQASVKHLEKSLILLENETRRLEKINEMLMRKYG